MILKGFFVGDTCDTSLTAGIRIPRIFPGGVWGYSYKRLRAGSGIVTSGIIKQLGI